MQRGEGRRRCPGRERQGTPASASSSAAATDRRRDKAAIEPVERRQRSGSVELGEPPVETRGTARRRCRRPSRSSRGCRSRSASSPSRVTSTAPSAAPPGLVTPSENRVIAPMASSAGAPSAGTAPRAAAASTISGVPWAAQAWRQPAAIAADGAAPKVSVATTAATSSPRASSASRERGRIELPALALDVDPQGLQAGPAHGAGHGGARERGHRHEAPLPGECCEGDHQAGGPVRNGHAPESRSELDRTGAAVGVVARRLRARVVLHDRRRGGRAGTLEGDHVSRPWRRSGASACACSCRT